MAHDDDRPKRKRRNAAADKATAAFNAAWSAAAGGKNMKTKNTKNTNVPTIRPNAYVIVRSPQAGVFAGILASRTGQEVLLQDARRIWYWAGATTLSELAILGPAKPGDCKFAAAVSEVLLTEAVEILPVSVDAETVIRGVPIWSVR